MPLTQWQAIAISAVSLTAGWFIYDGLCRTRIGERTVLLALSVFALILIASVLYTKVFSGRGAFIHVGALVGTVMAANVFAIIIPNQKKMIAQMIAGQTPEARFGIIGKQRSIDNNYLTLPVLLMMVSQHYPFLFSHPQSWLVVALILISGGLVRHILNRLDAGDDWDGYGWALPAAAMALLAAIYVTAPQARTAAAGAPVTDSPGFGDHHQALHYVPRQTAQPRCVPRAAEERLARNRRRHAALGQIDRRADRAEPRDADGQPDRHDRRRARDARPLGQRREMSALDPLALGLRAEAMLTELGAISAEPGRRVRLFLTPEHRLAADLVATWMRNAGLAVSEDALGTVKGRCGERAGGC